MQSNGGVVPANAAERNAVRMLLSGPAAGVRGAIEFAQRNGLRDILTLDMGGTSTDVALVPGLLPQMVPQLSVDRLPIRTPAVDMVTVGAGGGSIASLDPGGLLAVGPASAGADPGPAAYGNGGTAATVTDAQIAAGIIRPERFFGGKMQLDPEAAADALTKIGAEDEPAKVADAVLRVVDSNMAQALRLVSTARGIDPTDFTLVAYGGAGPLHAASVAAEIGIARVLIPWSPGLTSAFGLLVADVTIDLVRTILEPLSDATLDAARLSDLRAAWTEAATAHGLTEGGFAVEIGLDLRYRGQAFELTVWGDDAPRSAADLRDGFEVLHLQRYGYTRVALPVEAVSIRTRLVEPTSAEMMTARYEGEASAPETRRIVCRGRAHEAAFVAREGLRAGERIAGPAVIEEGDGHHTGAAGLDRHCHRGGRPSPREERAMREHGLDATEIAVVARALRAAADEMNVSLIRSAFSTVVREAQDCSTALLDAGGRVIAQAETIPMQTAALSLSFAAARHQLDLEGVTENHAIIMNDPYSGGQHLNDIILFRPVIQEGALIGWAGSTAHHLDIGGGSAGVNTSATDLIQEGLIIPPILLDVERDWNGGPIVRLIFANIRTKEIGLGDIDAQFAANHTGALRLKELARRYGVDPLKHAMDEVLDYAERRMRAAIGELPDGTYEGQAQIDRDIFEDRPIRLACTATIKGSDLAIDFEGTDAQVRGMFNCPLASAHAAVFAAVRCVIADKELPANDGCNRPLDLRFPRVLFSTRQASLPCARAWPPPRAPSTASTTRCARRSRAACRRRASTPRRASTSPSAGLKATASTWTFWAAASVPAKLRGRRCLRQHPVQLPDHSGGGHRADQPPSEDWRLAAGSGLGRRGTLARWARLREALRGAGGRRLSQPLLRPLPDPAAGRRGRRAGRARQPHRGAERRADRPVADSLVRAQGRRPGGAEDGWGRGLRPTEPAAAGGKSSAISPMGASPSDMRPKLTVTPRRSPRPT